MLEPQRPSDDRELNVAGRVDAQGAGKAEFLVASLEDLQLGDRRFDLIFAVRVGLFDREPERAHALVEPWLMSGGSVHAFFDPPVRRLARPADQNCRHSRA
jgi:hypothetical protein